MGKRPEKTEREKIEHIKGENRQLRKIVKQLRKENESLRQRSEYLESIIEHEEEHARELLETRKERNKPKCPDCDSIELTFLNLAGREYYFCDDCGSRGKKEKLGA